MKLHGLARVKNEGDVIEEFVRHTLSYLDELTVIDNGSFDGTRDVLLALQAEGLPLAVVDDPTLSKRLSHAMTFAARRCAAVAEWDYLFLLDADEFLKADGRADLERALAALPAGANGLLPWFTYVPTAEDDHAERRVTRRICYRRVTEAAPPVFKVVISGAFARGAAFSVAQGNHLAYDARGAARSEVLERVGLAHFPVRSLPQIHGKALLGWGAYLTMPTTEVRDYGWHQRRLFERLESGPAWTQRDLHEIALHYTEAAPPAEPPPLVYDPVPARGALRFGNAALTDHVQLSARYVRQLAAALAESGVTAPSE